MKRNYRRFLPLCISIAVIGTLTSAGMGRSATAGASASPGSAIAIYNSWITYQGGAPTSNIWIMHGDGSQPRQVTADTTNPDTFPRLNAAGTEIVFSRRIKQNQTMNQDLWVMSLSGSGQTQLTSTPETDTERYASWSPDSSKITYALSTTTDSQIWVINADGTNATQLTSTGAINISPSWAPDGQKILYASMSITGTTQTLYCMNPDGSGQTPISFTGASFTFAGAPVVSPDGTKLAFFNDSTEQGYSALYVWNFTESGCTATSQIAQVDPGAPYGLYSPTWSPDGSTIAYEQRDISTSISFISSYNLATATSTPLTGGTTPGGGEQKPSWGGICCTYLYTPMIAH